MLVLDEDEGEGVEPPRGAEPDELGLPRDQLRPELRGVPPADRAVDAVGGHHEIGVAEAQTGEVGIVAHLAAEAEVDAEPGGALLEDLQQLHPGDAGEAVAAGGDRPPLEVDVDVVPAREVVGDLLERLRIGGLEVAERLVREDDAPPERGVRRVALEDDHLVRRVRLLHQQREIEPRRPAADDRDLHGDLRALTGGMLARGGGEGDSCQASLWPPSLWDNAGMGKTAVNVKSLSRDEQFDLLDQLWESLGRDPEAFPMSDSQREELDRRLDELEAEGPTGLSWEEVVAQIRASAR